MSSPKLVVAPDASAVCHALADHIERAARAAIAARGQFRIGLSGGSSPRELYELLASPERAARIAWQDWRVFFSDERAVPPDDARSNFRMASAAWLSKVDLPEFAVHRMRGELPAELAAELYESELGDLPLDFVLLGLGEDGHTASLFPGDAALDETVRRVVAGRAPVEPTRRVTLTLRALSEAREIAFLVIGEGKRARVAQVIEELASGSPELVAARVRAAEALWFYLDQAAGGAATS